MGKVLDQNYEEYVKYKRHSLMERYEQIADSSNNWREIYEFGNRAKALRKADLIDYAYENNPEGKIIEWYIRKQKEKLINLLIAGYFDNRQIID